MGVRAEAVVAAVAVSAGGVALAVATAGTDLAAYVSESGIPGAPHEGVYRGGMFAVAAGLLLLSRAAPRWPGLMLLVAAPFAALSGVVTCSPGCPLPPYETATARDLVHAGAAITALGFTGLAMLASAWFDDDPVVRRVGIAGSAVAIPLLAVSGGFIAFAGRGAATGALERVAIAAACGWLVAAGVATAVRRRPRAVRSPATPRPVPGSR